MRVFWLPDRLRSWGVHTVEVEGWRNRGGDDFDPRGLVVHHTGATSPGPAPSLALVVRGRADLRGPLCHVLLGRDGAAHVVASGVANHAGRGGWRGLAGNEAVLGIEAENDGRGEPWPAVQLAAFLAVSAALLDGIGRGAEWLCGHKEWTTRKIDPYGLDMGQFRADVAALMAGRSEAMEAEYVLALYRGFGLTADKAGFNHWLKTLLRGVMTRDQVRGEFAKAAGVER